MTDYTLYYWPIAFRGQFVRSVLAQINVEWVHESDVSVISDLRLLPPDEQPVPHMGPPVLHDHQNDVTLSQLPAILLYLGEEHSLIPDSKEARAATLKLICDANDVLYEMTRYHGEQMWTEESWAAFQPRLIRWMKLFEAAVLEQGAGQSDNWLLGTEEPGIADLTCDALWGTMADLLAGFRSRLMKSAPNLLTHCDRVASLPEQQALREKSRNKFGDAWCGGEIEASLRAQLS